MKSLGNPMQKMSIFGKGVIRVDNGEARTGSSQVAREVIICRGREQPPQRK